MKLPGDHAGPVGDRALDRRRGDDLVVDDDRQLTPLEARRHVGEDPGTVAREVELDLPPLPDRRRRSRVVHGRGLVDRVARDLDRTELVVRAAVARREDHVLVLERLEGALLGRLLGRRAAGERRRGVVRIGRLEHAQHLALLEARRLADHLEQALLSRLLEPRLRRRTVEVAAEVLPRRADHAELRVRALDRHAVEERLGVGLSLRARGTEVARQRLFARRLDAEVLRRQRLDRALSLLGLGLRRIARVRREARVLQTELPLLLLDGDRVQRGGRVLLGARARRGLAEERRRLLVGRVVGQAHGRHDGLDGRGGELRIGGVLRAGAGVRGPLIIGDAELLLRALLERAARQTGDLHLDRVPGHEQERLRRPERVDPVPDVLQSLVHHGVRRPLRGRQDHRHAALQVQTEDRARAGQEQGDRAERQQAHQHQRDPERPLLLLHRDPSASLMRARRR